MIRVPGVGFCCSRDPLFFKSSRPPGIASLPLLPAAAVLSLREALTTQRTHPEASEGHHQDGPGLCHLPCSGYSGL
ncbi:hypothetical protein P8C59_001438 [Phyllachora maydis]|uniref:Uncharacterized protein n=1 Tax=Phyllachora maydis TaxID=1825666 RepID=A0AAD9MA87_9PEZI|nr:hypothetical protein P8C59_001438 [Phyllachora maydis]